MLMRYDLVTSSCAFLFLLLAGTASAEDARALIDRAIQAHGGAARLERTKKGHVKAKCEVKDVNAPFEYEIEEWFDLPARNKRIYDEKGHGTARHVEWLFMGKESWMREGSRRVEHKSWPVSLSAEQQQWYAVLAILLLLREKDAQLTSLPEETKDGRILAGIHVVYFLYSGDYFFDKSTGLLARSKRTWQSPVNGEEEDAETIYEDYRDIQGIHYPMRFKVAAKKYSSTFTLSSIEFLDKIDESIFSKPQTPAVEGPIVESSEETQEQRKRILIVVTVAAGVVIGAVWFIVRASKRSNRETPPS